MANILNISAQIISLRLHSPVTLIKLLRPKQWIKNTFVLLPLFFSLKFSDYNSACVALIGTLSFIFLSSAIYVINDLLDKDEDKNHPVKFKRPIASGQISPSQALLIALSLLLLCALSLKIIHKENNYVLCLPLLYLCLNVAYSAKLKQIEIIDVMSIAMGFVLRVIFGGVIIGVKLSPWILMTTFLLCLFLGFSKRYNELSIMSSDINRSQGRRTLGFYNKKLLESFIISSCSATLICYCLYAVQMSINLNKSYFVFSTVFVIYGLFRYLQRVFISNNSDNNEPENILFKDLLFLSNALIWLFFCIFILK